MGFFTGCCAGFHSTSCRRISALVPGALPLFLPSPWSLQKFLTLFFSFPPHTALWWFCPLLIKFSQRKIFPEGLSWVLSVMSSLEPAPHREGGSIGTSPQRGCLCILPNASTLAGALKSSGKIFLCEGSCWVILVPGGRIVSAALS